jgi:hypothetical protein
MRANWQTTTFIWNKQEVTLERGELICGLHEDSKATGLSVRNVRTARETLETLKMTIKVTSKSTNKYTVLKVTNYDTYNDQKGHTDRVNDNQSDKQVTSKRQASDNIQECISIEKNIKEEKDLCVSSEKDAEKTKRQQKQEGWQKLYDDLWEMYPKRDGKKIGKTKAFDRLLDIHDKHYEDIFNAVKNFAKAKETNNYGIKDFERFLKDDHYREWIDKPETASRNNGNVPTYEEKLEYHSARKVQERFMISQTEGYISRFGDTETWSSSYGKCEEEVTDKHREVDKNRRAQDLKHEYTAGEKARWYKANPGQ